MAQKNKKDGFIMQAGILAAAGIISRLIGLLYRSPLTAVIGDEGMGYYSSAYNIYTIILLISSYSIPSAISKVIAQKLVLKEYRNAHKLFLCAVWYVLIVGTATGLFLFFGAGLLVDGPAVIVLKVFAPTIFLYGLLGVLRGYFQAHKTMVQTSVSQILEQILNCIVSIAAALLLIMTTLGSADKYVITQEHQVQLGTQIVSEAESYVVEETGETVYVLTKEQQEWNTKHATYGAVGSALGTGMGVLTALLFMWAVYGMNRSTIYRRIERDRTRKEDSYGEIIGTVMHVVTPFILSTALYNLNTSLNQTIYSKYLLNVKKGDITKISTDYGIFAGKAVVIANIPIALATAMSSAVIPSISEACAQGDYEGAREKVAKAIKTTMLISIPAAVGIGVLARPVTWLLYPQKSSIDMASGLLTALAVSIIFFALSTLTNSVLQGIGRVNTPVIHSAVALCCQTLALFLLLHFTNCNLYGLVIANIVYSFVMCLLNQIAVRKYLDYEQEVVRTYLIPLLASLFMGALAWAVYQGLYLLTSSNVLSLFPAIILGAVLYFALMILLKGLTEEEIRELPKGHLLLRAARKMKLL